MSEHSAEKDLPPICGAVRLVPISLLPGFPSPPPGITKAAMVCVREPGHPELDADSSLHLCGTFAWAVGPRDDDGVIPSANDQGGTS